MSLVDVRRGSISEGPRAHQAEACPTTRAALALARGTSSAWARTSIGDRAELLSAAARRIRRHDTDLAEAVAAETGQRIADAWIAVGEAAAALDHFAELATLSRGRSVQSGWGGVDLLVPEPFGVAAVLPAWFDPVAGACRAIAACLVAGNAVVCAPSPRASAAGGLLVEIMGLPPGVLCPAPPTAPEALAAHPAVDLVWAYGTAADNQRIASAAAGRMTKVIVGGGGKDPLIVDAGVDPVWAAAQAAAGAFVTAPCSGASAERIFVHQKVAKRFLRALVEAAEGLVRGSPLDPATEVAWLADDDHGTLLDAHVSDAVDRGASCLTGGVREDRAYAPTVLSACTSAMKVMSDETHGPVAAVQVVGDVEEAVDAANSVFARAATVLTPSTATAQMAWRALRFETVRINGSWLDHSIGDGTELLAEVTRTKTVHVAP